MNLLQSIKDKLHPVEYERAAPFTFEPPFRANVSETYISETQIKDLEKTVKSCATKERKILIPLLKLRNLLVKRFGFKTDWQEGEFGPFDIKFFKGEKEYCTIRYEDPHFSFYAELTLKSQKLTLNSAVHFKTPEGLLYFWSIYLVHVQVFKSLMRELATANS